MSTDPAETLRRFVYVVSHDLQGPLRRITSFADLLVEELGGDLSEDATMFLEFIKANAVLVQDRVDGLRLISRAMRVEVQIKDGIDVAALAREAASLAKVPPNAVTIDAPALLRTDRDVVLRILTEGMRNARLWGAGERLHVRCACEPVDEGWRITLTDQGEGVAESRRELVFEPFHQLQPATAEGVGIGLPVARALAERLGGTLSLDASPGDQGASFVLTLPA